MDKASARRILQWVLTAGLVAGNIIPWLAVRNVAYQVAMNRHILLGRYREGQLTSLLTVLLISIPVLILIWVKPEKLKKCRLQILAITISIVLTVLVFDFALRFVYTSSYVTGGNIIRHKLNSVFRGVTRDVPKTAFSYPAIQPGYQDVPFVLTNDDRGFRNQTTLSECEIMTLGDSFAEGSKVSDEQIWPVLLAERTGRSVYNLGIGNGNPFTYLETLKAIGLELRPRTLLVMFYEGNDFRYKKPKTYSGFGHRLKVYRKRSPIVRAIKSNMIIHLGPVGVKRITNVPQGHRLWPVAWLPVAVPPGDGAKYYGFEWQRTGEHWTAGDGEEFAKTPAFQGVTGVLNEIKAICQERKMRLIVLYAPDKPHVVLPVAKDWLSPKQIRAFLALKLDDLPPANECLDTLIERLDVRESALASFCRNESIEFHSLTRSLQEGVAAGQQLYFSYDQHWTPPGHKVVVDRVTEILAADANDI